MTEKRILLIPAVILVFLITLTAFAETPSLRQKADAYDENLQANHVPEYGGVVEVVYETPEHQNVVYYKALGDSTMWTSVYLAAESFRYAVTGDPEAKENAIAAVQTLHNHKAVTQTTGYVGRYVGPVQTAFMLDYLGSHELRYGEGPWEGTFWLGNSSSDQHVGFFFGLGVAHELIDDEPTRQLIRDDLKEVVDKLRANNWIIKDERGWPTTAAPKMAGSEMAALLLTAAHVLDTPEYWELYATEFENMKKGYKFRSISAFSVYTEYFAFNLRHQNYYAMHVYETDPERRAFYWDVFSNMIRPYVEWTHNVYFDYIYLLGCQGVGQCDQKDEIIADALKSVTDFQDPPNNNIHVNCPSLPIDPISEFLVDLQELLGLEDILGFELITETPHEIINRCRVDYMWQRSPNHVSCFGFVPQHVFPGADYLLAYWMGRYYNFIDPVQTDDDDNGDDDVIDDDDVVDDDDFDDDDESPADVSRDDDDDSEGCGC